MTKNFYSILFKREIIPGEPGYYNFVKAEALFRLWEMKKKNCHCLDCKLKIKKIESYLEKVTYN